ncbi:MFS general substrate transporter [Neoconidiobolus thromboides FSU 785]|nr:MFS general substrate transporter [Neoconidiobolus thromboides FSU 785]
MSEIETKARKQEHTSNANIDEFGLERNEEATEQETHENNIISSKWKLITICFGLMLSIFIAAIDENIVATALGGIVKDFKASGDLTWIAASYLLTMTAFQPLYGKFSDIFGRKQAMLFALFIFLIGSIGCGAAPNIIALVVFRAIAGVGAGGLIALPFIIMSDVVPLQQRSAYMGLIQATFAISSVIGPIIGGLFVDYVTWRWVFYINVPISVIAMVVVLFLIPVSKAVSNATLKQKMKRVDTWGTLTLVTGSICIILATNWGGKEYSWGSGAVIGSFVAGIVVMAIFIFIELKVAQEPVIPSHIFTRNVIAGSITTIAFGFTMFTALNYIPLYHQTIHGRSATEAGVQTIPFMFGLSFFAGTSGLITNKTGTYRPIMWLGMTMIVLGNSLYGGLIRSGITLAEEIIYALLLGSGIGLNIQLALVASQASVPDKDAAVTTAFIRYALSIGGVLGLAVHGAVFNNVLAQQLDEILPGIDSKKIMESLESLYQLPSDQLSLALKAYEYSYKMLFVSMIPISVIGLISCLCIQHIPLDRNGSDQKAAAH